MQHGACWVDVQVSTQESSSNKRFLTIKMLDRAVFQSSAFFISKSVKEKLDVLAVSYVARVAGMH